MRKCAIAYHRESDGEQFWSNSVNEKGQTYCLCKRTTTFPTHTEATEFYGKNRRKQAQKRIDNDARDWRFTGYTPEIVEYESEPVWYFQLLYVLEHAYGDKAFDEVRKGFPLDKSIEYKLMPGHDRPVLDHLELSELERYYAWRKANYKGKRKDV